MEVGTSYSYPAYIFAAQFNGKSRFHKTATIYRGAHFRPNITLQMGKNTFLGSVVVLVPKLIMKDGSQIGAGTVLAGRDEIVLEKNVAVGYNCTMLTASDTPDSLFMNDATPESKRAVRRGPIVCKRNCFIGSNSTIMPKVTIGKFTVVGGGAYVDKNVPDYTILIPKQNFTIRTRCKDRKETTSSCR
jgi:acetyltransferase-like isoleucine patch superfamily enzyme